MPGVLIVEAMAQVGGVGLLASFPDRERKLIYLTGIDRCKFRRPVVPGDQLLIEVEMVSIRTRISKCRATAKVGGLTIHGETLIISTDQRIELVDLTNRVMEFVGRFNMREGLVSLWSMHTTCSLFINEFQTALLTDIKRFLEQMVARDAEWMHNNPEHSDCDRMNADSHLRALLLGHSLTLQVSGGEVVLGQWQRILMAELDGPRARSLRIQIFGIS